MVPFSLSKRSVHHLFAVIYFTAMLLGASHFHHDLRTHHSDCKVCMLTQNLSGGDLPQSQPPLETLLYPFTPFAWYRTVVSIPLLKGYMAQAPPSSL